MNTVVAIHQPNFLPWIGWWHKVVNSNKFIILGDVPFSDSMFIHRTRIRVPNQNSVDNRGWQWLTVPVKKSGKSGQLINEVQLVDSYDWRKAHLRTLQQNYNRAPYFEDYFPAIEKVYSLPRLRYLGEFNWNLIHKILNILKINDVTWHNDWEFDSTISKYMRYQRLLALTRRANGNVYLSGKTGIDELPLEGFREAGVDVIVQDVSLVEYPQVYTPFVPNLSILDLLFNVGHIEAKQFLMAHGSVNGMNLCDISEYKELQGRLF